MRITSIEFHPANSSDVAVLSFRDPGRQNPYNVKTIVGLDADEIVSRYYGISGGSNSSFYNLTLEQRNLVFRIELNARYGQDETPSDLRDRLYKMIASSRTGLIEIQFKNGTDVIAVISGFIQKLEAAHFTKTPEVQITIDCSDPLLKAPDPVNVDVVGLLPSLTVIEDTLSTAPHGFVFSMNFLDAMDSFTITDSSDQTFEIEPVGGFLLDDVLYFSSEHNNKQVFLVRGVDTFYLADAIVPGSVWPIIFPGENEFVCATATDLSWDAISYYPTYWGI